MKRTTIMLKALAVIVMSFFFSSSLLPQGDVVRSSSLVPQNSNNCIDLEFEQDGVLPSSQGFTYFANPTGIPEGAAFSVSGGVLHINTLGTGAGAGYLLPNAFNPSQDFTLEFRMKVFPGTGPFGIDFEVSDDVTDKDFEFGFVPDGILLPPPPAARPFSPFNTADDFHTYKVFSPGGTQIYQFFIDGMLVLSGTVSDGDPGPQRFVFGDLTGGSDGRADIDFIRYCQAPPTCVAPPSGMVSWWPGDGNANDIKGGNHGGLQNGATSAPGLVGQAFSFDGVDDFVLVPNSPALNPNSITVDAWIRPDSIGGFRRIVSKGQALVDLFIGPAAQLRCIVNPASLPFSCCGVDVPTAGVTVTAGVWSHVACTWDAPTGQGKVYLNGQQVGGTLDLADNNPLRSTVGDLFIGRAWFDSVSFFDGLIDEVEIFDRALTATEIQSLFNAGQAGKCKNRAPMSICQNVTGSADSSCTANASIDDGSFDPDGDSITITQSPAGPYPLGTTNVTLTITDSHGASSECTATVTVVDDTPPVLACPNNITANTDVGQCSTVVSYAAPEASDNCSGAGAPTCTPPSGATFPKGTTTVNCSVTDAASNQANCSFTVTVADTQAPTITMIAGQQMELWPPNHQYQTVSVSDFVVGASDNCSGNLTNSVVIASISSDEPDDASGGGDGNTINDIVIAADCRTAQLRAERQGSGNGRVYTITFRVKDAAGNVKTATAQVKVPKSQGSGATVDDGANHTVNSACP